MSFELTICKDKGLWDSFVSNSLQGNIFCRTPFLDSLNLDYVLYLVEKNGNPQLGIVVLRDKNGEVIRAPYSFCLYQGMLFEQKFETAPAHSRYPEAIRIVDFLLTELERSLDRISFCLHYNFGDLRSFSWFHYHQPQLGRFRIDLQYTGLLNLEDPLDFEKYFSKIRRLRRRDYFEAMKSNLSVELSKDIDKLDYLNRLTFQRQGIGRSNTAAKLLKDICAAALSGGFGQLLLCKDPKGEAIGATFFLFDEKCGYSLFAGNHPNYRDTGSGTLLMLENIKHCKERGLKWVDVCGINSPYRGDFKISFNVFPVPYFVVTWEKPR